MELSEWVTVTTPLAVTVTVSVLLAAAAGLAVAVPTPVMVRLPDWAAVAVLGTVPTATNLNVAPAANGPVVVIAVLLSGRPSPLRSA